MMTMPTYDYTCSNCCNEFESFRKISERKEAPCPQCGGIGVKGVSAPLVKLDQSFPGEHMKWGRQRKKLNNKL